VGTRDLELLAGVLERAPHDADDGGTGRIDAVRRGEVEHDLVEIASPTQRAQRAIQLARGRYGHVTTHPNEGGTAATLDLGVHGGPLVQDRGQSQSGATEHRPRAPTSRTEPRRTAV